MNPGIIMWRRAAGFTLIELLVSMVVLGVIVVISAGSFTSLISSARMTGEISSLQGALNLARSEAIKRGYSVSVCPAAGASNTTASCDTDTIWSNGWVILAATATSTATVKPPLFISPGVTHGDTLTSSLGTYPTFTQAGYTFYSGTITLHDSLNTQALYRCLVFSAGTWTMQTGASCP
jgi:type IV fimbrial biogenesis protein FimT